MKCSELLKVIGRFDTLIQCGYQYSGKYHKTGIMKLENVTMRHIDRWDFQKNVGTVIPCTDKQGRNFLFINLYEERK